MRNDREHQEQAALFQWTAYNQGKYPELERMFAIPNGGQRHKAVAGKLKAEGVKAGVPDIFLPVARGKYHGLFIEMKAGKNTTTPKQREWIAALIEQGYAVEVCYGWVRARVVLVNYLNGAYTQGEG